MKRLIAILFVSILGIANSINASNGGAKTSTAKQTSKQAKRTKAKITPVTIKALDPDKTSEDVMGWVNAKACGASGKEKCAIINDPQGTHFVKEVSTRGRKGYGFVGDIEGSKKHISGRSYKVLRVYKAGDKEPFTTRATYKYGKAYKASKTAESKPTKSTKKAFTAKKKTKKYGKRTKAGRKKYKKVAE